MNQLKIYILLLIMSMGQLALAQQGSNPFEIIRTNSKQAQDSTNVPTNTTASQPSAKPRANSGNAFEVYRNDDQQVITQPAIEESSTVDTLVDDANDDFEASDKLINSTSDYTDSNPFEVSHIPYRRSELKEQTKDSDVKTTVPANTQSRATSVVKAVYSSNTFIFWLILFSLLLLAIVVNVQRNAIKKVAKSITNENILKLNKREENSGITGHYIMLYVIFFINLACFLYLISKHYFGMSGVGQWFLVFGGVAAIYLVRHFSMFLLGFIFNVSKDSSLYSFTIMTFNIFLGLVLIPINLVVAFSPENISSAAMFIGIGLIVILLAIRLVRGLLMAVTFISRSFFQFFLYLCAFEIAPILILVRLLGDLK